ncbi:MAG: inositol 2-dehydrogenase [Anaerolineaceae bacterium]|nr:inositol 2-dehydrogenase [Anaerolineaceae bacterium]
MSIRIGLIGSGRMGEVFAHHLAFSIPEAEFAAVADVNHEAAKRIAVRYGAQRYYGDYAEILNQEDIDAVVIATPTNTHDRVIIDTANAGKHIFSEKPLALTLQGCDAALSAVKAAGVKLQVGFMRRYDPGYLLAKQKIDAGVIGTPVMFKSVGRDPKRTSLEFAKRVNSGGLIMDMGIHDFDLARWLMGSEIKRVFSEGDCLVFPELREANDIDNAVISLKFENGSVGAVDVSRNAVYGYDVRTEVMGSEGSLYIGKEQQTPLWVKTRAGISHDTVPYFMQRFAEAYAAEIKDFVTCLEEDKEIAVSGYDGQMATAIGIAATISFDETRPVELSELVFSGESK